MVALSILMVLIILIGGIGPILGGGLAFVRLLMLVLLSGLLGYLVVPAPEPMPPPAAVLPDEALPEPNVVPAPDPEEPVTPQPQSAPGSAVPVAPLGSVGV